MAASDTRSPNALAARRRAFRQLHESGCFVIPNPWDVGSARFLATLGFKALATTSAGCAWAQGRADHGAGLDLTLANVRTIVEATDLPVNADFEAGFADSPDGVAAHVTACVAEGVAGLSIEDSTNTSAQSLYDVPHAVERLRAAREAIDATGTGTLLVGRAECYLVGHPSPLAESIRRLTAYADAGADVLYAPGAMSRDDIAAIVAAVRPKPVNVLMGRNAGLTVADLAELGVRRISVGGALARAAWTRFARAAQAIATEGVFTGFDDLMPLPELNGFFTR